MDDEFALTQDEVNCEDCRFAGMICQTVRIGECRSFEKQENN